jgi:hypothetical protein
MEQLASAMATIVFSAILLVTALFYIERLHAPRATGEPIVQAVAIR